MEASQNNYNYHCYNQNLPVFSYPLPSTWARTSECARVPVDLESEEGKNINNIFHAAGHTRMAFNLTHLERNENQALFQKYKSEQKDGSHEVNLFYACDVNHFDEILKHGFRTQGNSFSKFPHLLLPNLMGCPPHAMKMLLCRVDFGKDQFDPNQPFYIIDEGNRIYPEYVLTFGLNQNRLIQGNPNQQVNPATINCKHIIYRRALGDLRRSRAVLQRFLDEPMNFDHPEFDMLLKFASLCDTNPDDPLSRHQTDNMTLQTLIEMWNRLKDLAEHAANYVLPNDI